MLNNAVVLVALNFFVAASPCAAGEFFLRNQDTVVKTGESITTQHLYNSLKADFANLPIDKRLTGPLFWQHGESDSTLKTYIDRMVDAGSGHFTIESRPHPDWLGPEWYADCKVILDYAKTKGLGGYIFDERLFPSFQVAGRVPAQHRTKVLACSNTDQTGPSTYSGAGYSGNAFIKAIAGKVVNGQIDAGTLTENGGRFATCPRKRASAAALESCHSHAMSNVVAGPATQARRAPCGTATATLAPAFIVKDSL